MHSKTCWGTIGAARRVPKGLVGTLDGALMLTGPEQKSAPTLNLVWRQSPTELEN
jgi:prophage tail gpP-like protein